MKTTAHQKVDFCHRCGNTVYVIGVDCDDEGVWFDVTKCGHCKQVSPGAEEVGGGVGSKLTTEYGHHGGGVSGEDLRAAVGDKGKRR